MKTQWVSPKSLQLFILHVSNYFLLVGGTMPLSRM